ncbi:MAG: phosphatidate cytidylyltransferase [Deltaproteobacteria bacterium]|nr:phosphatidate cytidylyltransferase [Deltaproteobacteria bacterium]
MMLKKRLITAAIALPLLFLLIFKGGQVSFTIFIGALSVITLWEYFRIVYLDSNKGGKGFIRFFAYLISLGIVWAAHIKSFELIVWFLLLNLIISGMASLRLFRTDPSAPIILAKQVLGVIYIPLFLSFLVLIRNGTDGIFWVLSVIVIVFLGDSGAYFAGSGFGKHKLSPTISPGKTVEGSIVGLVTSVVAGVIVKLLFFPDLPWGMGVLFFLVIGIFAQVGDLFESVFKRHANIKDSGDVLPGHGGFLDRVDALMFAAPAGYFFIQYVF